MTQPVLGADKGDSDRGSRLRQSAPARMTAGVALGAGLKGDHL